VVGPVPIGILCGIRTAYGLDHGTVSSSTGLLASRFPGPPKGEREDREAPSVAV
jgi:hypothetical protein